MRKKLVSPSRQLSPSRTRAVTARRKLATGLPLGVKRELGVVGQVAGDGDVGVGHGCPPRGSVGAGCSVAVVVRSGWLPPSWLVGQQVPAGVGVPLLVRHGPRLLPAGRALLLARPGRPGLSGPPRTTARSRAAAGHPAGTRGRSAASTAAPLTRAAARWQPDWQANGRGRWVQGPAGQRSGEAVPRRQPPPSRCDTIPLGNRRAARESEPCRGRSGSGCWS